MKSVSVLAALVAAAAPMPAATSVRNDDYQEYVPLLPTLVKKNKMRVGWVKGGTGPKHRSKAERNRRKAVRRARARNVR